MAENKDVQTRPDHTPDLWDYEYPRSLINLVPNQVAAAMELAKEKRPELFDLSEEDLRRRLRADNITPTPTDNRLRLKFWDEYDRTQANMEKGMTIGNVVNGVCVQNHFYRNYLKHPEKVAWLLCKPASYSAQMDEILNTGMRKMREILDLDLVDPVSGKVNVKLGELQAKITQMMDVRKHGAAAQRIEQVNKNMNLNISTTDKTVANLAMEGMKEDLDKQIKELERRERRALNLPIEAEARKVSDEEA